MIKEIKELLTECELLKNITICASPVQDKSTALMPLEERIVKKYTDGKQVRESKYELLFKTDYSLQGDYMLCADSFFEGVIAYLENTFRNSSPVYGEYEFIDFSTGSYTLKSSTPSSSTYSLILTFKYLKKGSNNG